ncbi:MAG: dockerin type I repeat-containing protein, partial [Bacteroidaceae bacterium]|nr:dockerin type I repeat-containing protein [Bacteroidaceae bacterium]
MKKFLLLMLTILMGAMWSSVDAKWVIGDRKNASQIQPGDTVVLEHSSRTADLEHYLRAVLTEKGVELQEGLGIGAAAIVVLEEGPLDVRTGAPTVYIKLVETNKYIGQSTSWDNGCGVVSDPGNAANFQIISCGEDIPWANTYGWDAFYSEENYMKDENGKEFYRSRFEEDKWLSGDETIANWRENGAGRGSDDNSVGFSWSKNEKDFKYLAFWSSTKPNILLWNYTDTQQWNVYGVTYEKSLQDDLQNLVDIYMEEGEYIAGTDPGFYKEEAVDAYNEAMQEALEVSITGTSDEDYQAAIDKLKNAHDALTDAFVPLTEGYYYFVCAFEKYLNEYGHEKGAYANDADNFLYYKTFDPEDALFVFEVTKGEENNEYWVQHFLSGLYVGTPSDWYSKNIPVTKGKDEPQNIRYYTGGKCTGKWFWGSRSQHTCSYTMNTNAGTPSDGAGKLYNWGQWGDEGTVSDQYNCWYLRKITDQSVIENFELQREQVQRTAQLREIVNDATELYAKLFSYEPDYSKKLITTVSGGADEDPAEGNQLTFSTIRTQGVAFADKYEFLIDDDDTTYMQGSGYIRVELKEPKQYITFVYNTRDASGHGSNAKWQQWGAQERPKMIDFYGYNTLAGDTVFGQAKGTGIDMGDLPLPATYTFDFGQPVNRVAFYVTQNANGGSYFTVSEFQMYEAAANQATSQYYTTEGMSEKADAMFNMLPGMREIVANNTATDEDIQTMQAAYSAVKEMYADTTALADLIAECETMLSGVEIGDEMGQLSDEQLKTNLEAAIANARETAFVSPISVSAVKAAETAVREAKAAFMAGIKSFEVGKWYFITNLDTERAGEAGAEDAFCQGNAIYLNKNYADGSITKWGLFDESSMTLNADNNPAAMWRFVPVEGTEFYAIQNMYTGYYLGDYAGDNINLPVSETPVPYEITLSGQGGFLLYPRGPKNKSHLAIWPEGYEADVVCHPSVDAASAWTFVEIDPEEQQAISISIFAMNLIDVMAVPYDVKDLADLNEDVHTYAVKKMTQETNEDGELVTTVELYEKNEFKAGEPCIIALGNWQEDEETAPYEPYDLVIPFPTEMVDHTHNFVANGIFGGLHSISLSNVAVSTGKDFIPYSGGFGAMTGFIDPSTYRGEVEGVETAATLVIVGDINLISEGVPGDVDGNGTVNSADVVAIYNFIITGEEETGIAKEVADIDGNGEVNSADVVAEYNIIIGGSESKAFAKSGSFFPEANITGSDNVLTVHVGNSDDKAKIPVSVYLANPTTSITS